MSYKLLSFKSGAEERAGLLVDGKVYDAPGWSTVLAALQDWPKAHREFAAFAKRIEAGKSKAKGAPLSRVKLLGEKPWHFVKTSRSSVVGPGAKVKLPAYSQKVDWEVELTAVIGRTVKDVPAEKALACVAGWTIANDLSARDAMKRDKNPPASPFHYDWVSQKCFEGSCPLGPWIVPAGDVGDPHSLGIRLWVNGELMQDSHTSKLIFDTAEQIAMLSSRVTLHPGDLVLTGTPA